MIEERDFNWTPDVEVGLVLDNVRHAVFGDIPAYVVREDGKRAKGSDIGKIKDQLARALEDSDGYNMIGYSIVFNQWTRIWDQDGEYMERVAPGAAAKAIKERGDRIIVQYDHGHHPMIGSLPVAAPRAVWEDEHGLFGWDRIHQSPQLDLLRENIRTRAIRGQSFRFSVPDGGDTWEPAKRGGLRRRTLGVVDILERGPVAWPAYEGTDVAIRSAVRAMPADLRTAILQALQDDDGVAYTAGANVDITFDFTRGTVNGRGTDEPAVHVGTDDPAAVELEQVPGTTRREMRLEALSRLGVPLDSDRGAA